MEDDPWDFGFDYSHVPTPPSTSPFLQMKKMKEKEISTTDSLKLNPFPHLPLHTTATRLLIVSSSSSDPLKRKLPSEERRSSTSLPTANTITHDYTSSFSSSLRSYTQQEIDSNGYFPGEFQFEEEEDLRNEFEEEEPSSWELAALQAEEEALKVVSNRQKNSSTSIPVPTSPPSPSSSVHTFPSSSSACFSLKCFPSTPPSPTSKTQKDVVLSPTKNDRLRNRIGLSLNADKAGLQQVNKEEVNKTIYELSKGSKFFDNEAKKMAQVEKKVEEMREKLKTIER
jgi:hypothetical protein